MSSISSLNLDRIPLTFQFDGLGMLSLKDLFPKLYDNREHYETEKSHCSSPFKIHILKEQFNRTYIQLKNVQLNKGEALLSLFKYREFINCHFNQLPNGEQLTDGAKEVLINNCKLEGNLSFKNVDHLCFNACDFSNVTLYGRNIDTITLLFSYAEMSFHSETKQKQLLVLTKQEGFDRFISVNQHAFDHPVSFYKIKNQLFQFVDKNKNPLFLKNEINNLATSFFYDLSHFNSYASRDRHQLVYTLTKPNPSYGLKGLPKLNTLQLVGDKHHILDPNQLHFFLKTSRAKSLLIKDFIINGALSSLSQSLKEIKMTQCHLTLPETLKSLSSNVKVLKLNDITTKARELTIADSVQSIFLKQVTLTSFKFPKTVENLTLVDMNLKNQCKKLPNIQGQLVLKGCSLTLKDDSILKQRFSESFSPINSKIVDTPENDYLIIKETSLINFPKEKIKPTYEWIHCQRCLLNQGEDQVLSAPKRVFEDCSLINIDKQKLFGGASEILLWNVKVKGLLPFEKGASCQLKNIDLNGVSFPETRLKKIEIVNSSLKGLISLPNANSLTFFNCSNFKKTLRLIKKPPKKLTIGHMPQFTLDCSIIPQELKELHVSKTSIDSGTIESLPLSLEKLHLDDIKGEPIDCSKLPKKLETLILSSITINSKVLLPPSIKHVQFLYGLTLSAPLFNPIAVKNNLLSLHIDASILSSLYFTAKSVNELHLTNFLFEKISLQVRSHLPIASKHLALYDSVFNLSDLEALMDKSITSIQFFDCDLRCLFNLAEFLSKYPNLEKVTVDKCKTAGIIWEQLRAPIALTIKNSQASKKLSIIQNI